MYERVSHSPKIGPQKLKPTRKTLLVMGSITIKSGTPRASDALCRTCTHSHILEGFSATEEFFCCEQLYPTRPVPFLICECTLYEDKRRAPLKSMVLIAWYLTTKKAGRSVGFVMPRDSMRFKRSRIGPTLFPQGAGPK